MKDIICMAEGQRSTSCIVNVTFWAFRLQYHLILNGSDCSICSSNVYIVCVLTTLQPALYRHFTCYRSSGVCRFAYAIFKTSGWFEMKLNWFLESIDAMCKAGESDMLISTAL